MTPEICAETSVVVPTRDRPDALRELVRSLAACTPAPAELVIVDDASRVPLDLTDVEPHLPFRLRVIRNDRNIGPASARNVGVHRSRGAFLLFTDDDCVVDPSWVGALTVALARSGDDCLAGVGGRIEARDRDVISRYYEHHRILEPREHDSDHPTRIPYLVTANCALRRDVFMRAGGFDGRVVIAGGDDVALSMRVAKLGYHFEHNLDALVWHRFRPGITDFARTFYRYGLGGRYVVDRYLPF